VEVKKRDRRCVYEGNFEVRSCNHCCCKKAIRITYSECVSVALGIQHAKHVRRIIVTFVACPAVPLFSTLSHKRRDYRVGVCSRTQNAFSFSLKHMSETFVILRIIRRNQISMKL